MQDVFIQYREYKFTERVLETIDRANLILNELGRQGYTLTLRQLYYQFVRRNWIENREQEYKRLGRILTDAREAGLVSWTAIEDRGRNCYGFAGSETHEDALRGVERNLTLDPWRDQPTYLEVWIEKQALEGVIKRPCARLRVPYMACKGHLSATEAWLGGQRFQEASTRGKDCVLIHLADHDPSGVDMTRDNRERLSLFSNMDVEVRRIALNMDQVEEFDPPPNPAKVTDSRYAGYVKLYGEDSWELDALEPAYIDELIMDTVRGYIDQKAWDATMAEERRLREPLAALSGLWPTVMHRVMLDRP